MTDSLTAALLVSLRLAPTLAFAQPFTLLRVPVVVRVLLAVASRELYGDWSTRLAWRVGMRMARERAMTV